MNKHRFETNDKGLMWLVVVTLAAVGISLFLVYLVMSTQVNMMEIETKLVIEFWILVAFAPVMLMSLYLDWKSYLYADDTQLEIDMQSRTLTYKHGGKVIAFNGLDVEHLYTETGMLLSRVAGNHVVIVLRTGEQLFVPCWLFDGNEFFLSDVNKYNACFFLRANWTELLIREPRKAPRRYDYLFPEKIWKETERMLNN